MIPMPKITALALLSLFTLLSAPVFGQQTVQSVYAEAVRDFKAENYAEAMEKFELVLQHSPNYAPARSYLFKCKNMIAAGAGKKNDMEGALAKLVLPSIDLTDAPVGDVLVYLADRAEELSGGKFVPNFIYKGTPEQRANSLITLNMRNVPMDQAIKYVGQLSGSRVKYEEHAIVIDPNGSDPNAGVVEQVEAKNEASRNPFTQQPEEKKSIFD